MSTHRTMVDALSRMRLGLVFVLVLTVLLGLLNWLVVNQTVVLYLFYLPVVFAALALPKRDSVGVAALAGLMVIAYIFFLPKGLHVSSNRALLWAEILAWSGILMVTAYMVATLKARMQAALSNLQRAYRGVLAILSRFIPTVDADTEAHCVRVSAWAVHIAQELGLTESQMEEARFAGLLHDVGKVDVSVELLRKTAALSREEHAQIREHTARGAAMIKPVGGMLSYIADAIEAHHEKYDGSGYKGIRGEQIPLLARIVAVADVFDVLLSDRPYRKGIAIHEALDSIVASAGTSFDPVVVDALRRIVNREGDLPATEAVADFLREGGDEGGPAILRAGIRSPE